ncbi:DUF6710 family protein [Solibacillus sp. CAU 1738]|uniref:DUF6710 family protein n=1 Tax=Solibacillus sp. CAU 1738 TaxID=3140363 RepID=UPI00326014D5
MLKFKSNSSIKKKFIHSLEMAKKIIEDNKNISLESIDHPIYKVINIFAMAIQSDLLRNVITTHEYDIPKPTSLFYPDYDLLKKHNIKLKIYDGVDTSRKVDIDFSRDMVLSLPWSSKRFRSALFNLKRGDWLYDSMNHRAEFLEPFKIGVIMNGIHSSSIGILNRQGNMPAQVIDLSSLFDLIETDGIYYYSKKNKGKISKVKYFEEAVIFEIGRLINSNKY